MDLSKFVAVSFTLLCGGIGLYMYKEEEEEDTTENTDKTTSEYDEHKLDYENEDIIVNKKKNIKTRRMSQKSRGTRRR
jgi:hypothetical protein